MTRHALPTPALPRPRPRRRRPRVRDRWSRRRRTASESLLALALFLLAPAASAEGLGPEPAPAPAGGAVWPLDPQPQVVSRFDPPSSRWGPGHRGVDLLGAVGQPVHAAEDGTVSFAGRLAGRGVVVVTHGSTRTTYEPVSAQLSAGDRVRAGDLLGRLELLGSHCLPRACLHWGLIEGERYLDPLTLVGSGTVWLLPWLDGAVQAADPGQAQQSLVPQLPTWRPLGQAALFRA